MEKVAHIFWIKNIYRLFLSVWIIDLAFLSWLHGHLVIKKIIYHTSFVKLNFKRGVEAEGEEESYAGSAPCVEPHLGLDLTKHETMTWAKAKSWTLRWLSHPGSPISCSLNMCYGKLPLLTYFLRSVLPIFAFLYKFLKQPVECNLKNKELVLRFSLELLYIYTLIWEKLTFFNYWVFLSINGS